MISLRDVYRSLGLIFLADIGLTSKGGSPSTKICVPSRAALQGQQSFFKHLHATPFCHFNVIITVTSSLSGYSSAAFPLGGASIIILGNHYAFWRVLGPHPFWARKKFFSVSFN